MAAGEAAGELVRGVPEVGFEADGAEIVVGEVGGGRVDEGGPLEEGREVDGHGLRFCGYLIFEFSFFSLSKERSR